MEQAHQRGGHPETFILLDLQRIPLRPGNLAGRPSGRILFPSLRRLSALKVVLQVPAGACGVGLHSRWYALPVRRAPAAAARTQPRRMRPGEPGSPNPAIGPAIRARPHRSPFRRGAGVAAPATSCCLYQAEMAHRRQGPVAFDEVAVAPRAASGLARAGQSRGAVGKGQPRYALSTATSSARYADFIRAGRRGAPWHRHRRSGAWDGVTR